MRSAVALMLAGSMMLPGCFPHNSRNRTISEIVEGGLSISGVVVEGVVQSGADCDMTHAPGAPPVSCKQNASLGGGIGVALILAGVIGFIATISTSEDDDDKPKPIEIKAKPEVLPTTAEPVRQQPAPAPSAAPTPSPAGPAATPAT
ncbi:MAG: hypothetical protein ABJE66_25325 [Deltaproteobacteria bacterium]